MDFCDRSSFGWNSAAQIRTRQFTRPRTHDSDEIFRSHGTQFVQNSKRILFPDPTRVLHGPVGLTPGVYPSAVSSTGTIFLVKIRATITAVRCHAAKKKKKKIVYRGDPTKKYSKCQSTLPPIYYCQRFDVVCCKTPVTRSVFWFVFVVLGPVSHARIFVTER